MDRDAVMAAVTEAVRQRRPSVLVSGPTGCGKTSACMAALHGVPGVISWDPVETAMRSPVTRMTRNAIVFADDVDVAVHGVKGGGVSLLGVMRSMPPGVTLVMTASGVGDRAMSAVAKEAEVVAAMAPLDYARMRAAVRAAIPGASAETVARACRDRNGDVRAALIAAGCAVPEGPRDHAPRCATAAALGPASTPTAAWHVVCRARMSNAAATRESRCDSAVLARMVADLGEIKIA